MQPNKQLNGYLVRTLNCVLKIATLDHSVKRRMLKLKNTMIVWMIC